MKDAAHFRAHAKRIERRRKLTKASKASIDLREEVRSAVSGRRKDSFHEQPSLSCGHLDRSP